MKFFFSIAKKLNPKNPPSNKGADDVEIAISQEMKKKFKKDPMGTTIEATKIIGNMEGETASAFSFASAKALARLAAAMANKGCFKDTMILSE